MNFGVEGRRPTATVLRARARQMRNFLATLFLSQGVPMICSGDEIGRTQGGNNNAYVQDNPVSWLDWDLDEPRRALLAFVQKARGDPPRAPVVPAARVPQGGADRTLRDERRDLDPPASRRRGRAVRGGNVGDVGRGLGAPDARGGGASPRGRRARLEGDPFEPPPRDDVLLLPERGAHERSPPPPFGAPRPPSPLWGLSPWRVLLDTEVETPRAWEGCGGKGAEVVARAALSSCGESARSARVARTRPLGA